MKFFKIFGSNQDYSPNGKKRKKKKLSSTPIKQAKKFSLNDSTITKLKLNTSFEKETTQVKKPPPSIQKDVVFCKKIPNSNAPLLTAYSMVSYNNKIYVFGGITNLGEYINDIYTFDLRKKTWEKMIVYSEKPTPRCHHTCIVYEDKMIVYGGIYGKKIAPNRLWAFDFKHSSSWFLTIQTGNMPKQRYGHSSVLYNGKDMIIFGGHVMHQGVSNEIYSFDCRREKWTQLIPKTKQAPKPRKHHTSVIYDTNMYIYGGVDDSQDVFGDLWIFNFESLTWKEVLTAFIPSQRFLHTSVAWNGGLFIIGGRDKNVELNDMYRFSFKKNTWKKVANIYNVNAFVNSTHAALILDEKLYLYAKDRQTCNLLECTQDWNSIDAGMQMTAQDIQIVDYLISNHMIKRLSSFLVMRSSQIVWKTALDLCPTPNLVFKYAQELLKKVNDKQKIVACAFGVKEFTSKRSDEFLDDHFCKVMNALACFFVVRDYGISMMNQIKEDDRVSNLLENYCFTIKEYNLSAKFLLQNIKKIRLTALRDDYPIKNILLTHYANEPKIYMNCLKIVENAKLVTLRDWRCLSNEHKNRFPAQLRNILNNTREPTKVENGYLTLYSKQKSKPRKPIEFIVKQDRTTEAISKRERRLEEENFNLRLRIQQLQELLNKQKSEELLLVNEPGLKEKSLSALILKSEQKIKQLDEEVTKFREFAKKL